MPERKLQEYDMQALAENGLRRGFTTGTCAAAAVKAALIKLLTGDSPDTVIIALPDGQHYLPVQVSSINESADGTIRAEVVKFAGDDPDQTDSATIFAEVRNNGSADCRFLAGEGVGIVTSPGIRVPVGQPAINPVPRQMMLAVVEEVLEGEPNPGFDLTIGCVNGEQIAKKTFNPRLGIKGGISILGTTGIVEPMSLSAYQASIEVYIRVALSQGKPAVAYLPGNIGINFAKNTLQLAPSQIVHISNFLGYSLEATSAFLEESSLSLSNLWILGHPGKLAKVLDGVWDTHSSKSPMAMRVLAKVANNCGYGEALSKEIEAANTVEGVIDVLQTHEFSRQYWTQVESLITDKLIARLNHVHNVGVRLFSMSGKLLGGGAA